MYLLKKQNRKPSSHSTVLVTPSLVELQTALPMSGVNDLQGIDLETRGTDPTLPDSEIVGIGVANEHRSVFVDLCSADPATIDYLRNYLVASTRLVAFNVMFDGSFLYKFCGRWLAWEADSFGLFKHLSTEGFDGQRWNLETMQLEFLGWPVSNKGALEQALAERKLTKADMWQLPPAILGPYCAQDAEAALQGYEELAKVCREMQFTATMDWHRREFMDMARLLVIQQHAGITVDVDALRSYLEELDDRIGITLEEFETHPQVAPVIAEYNALVAVEHAKKEPPKLTKQGKVSARWQAWDAAKSNLPKFNSNSKKQLAWLFYEKLGMKITRRTETKQPSVDKKTLPSLGEPGKLLAKYAKLVKEQGYVIKCLRVVREDGRLHPQFRWPGTLTGRPAGGGGFNMLQQPKTGGYLRCLKAAPGKKLVQADFSALEPTILAEFSQCPSMLRIYGEGQPVNDIYLFTACNLGSLGKKIRQYYDPENPTVEGIEAAKKHCKTERNVAKTLTLAVNYSARPKSIHESLVLAGVDMTRAEVDRMYWDYWRLYSGVKQFDTMLRDVWSSNGGYIINGGGHPTAVAHDKLKDILNRFCQSTANVFLCMYVSRIYRRCAERGIELTPWLCNFYDETIGECAAEDAEKVADIYRECLAEMNAELDMTIKLKAEPMIADNLAEIKGAV